MGGEVGYPAQDSRPLFYGLVAVSAFGLAYLVYAVAPHGFVTGVGIGASIGSGLGAIALAIETGRQRTPLVEAIERE